jgi:SAM-dependent methyltransferase
VNKSSISSVLRRLKLLYFADLARFYLEKLRNKKANAVFRKNNPDVQLPPDYLMYESFQLNYEKYYTGSIDTAKWLVEHLSKYKKPGHLKILDRGCGPGRVIRHLPEILGDGCEYYGTDYNPKSIQWCSDNLKNISFNLNSLEADLPYLNDFFDFVYGLSIFTHLSEDMHYWWIKELLRTLKHDGILFLTTQGDNFKIKLTQAELEKYERGELVVRGKVKEGHRTYSAFHPEEFMRRLFCNVEVLEHITSKPLKGSYLPQDVWMVRKK